MHIFSSETINGRKLLRTLPRQITSIMNADVLWEMGITGAGIKVSQIQINCDSYNSKE